MVVAGTGTDVGKTWIGCQLLAALRRGGRTVAARKPAQSFEPGTRAADTDAGRLAAATGEDLFAVCPAARWYEVAMAPPMAADVLGRPAFTVADLRGELSWSEGLDLGLVETAGGVRSPLASDGDTVDLVRLLRPDSLVLVADAGLGTINAVRLSVAALGPHPPAIVLLNRFDPADDLHARNLAWLRRDGLDVLGGPAALGALASRLLD